jgi:hypothetical protein
MRVALSAFSLACLFVIGCIGCSGHDDVGAAQDAGTTSDASPIVTNDGGVSDAASSQVDTAPKLCWVAHSADPSNVACDSCSQSACDDHWSATWGAGWSTDDFGGPCAKDAACLCTCDEEDLVCRQNCDITFESDACRAAKQALYDCETADCSKPCGRSF